jgi:hypothetical protein
MSGMVAIRAPAIQFYNSQIIKPPGSKSSNRMHPQIIRRIEVFP